MKIKYQFVNETVEIEVEEHWGELVLELDRQEYNSARKHSRRYPIAIDDADYEGEWFSDGTDILGDIVRAEDKQCLLEAVAKLRPEQQDLIHEVYGRREKIVNIARRQGVTESAVRDRLRKIHRRLKKILD